MKIFLIFVENGQKIKNAIFRIHRYSTSFSQVRVSLPFGHGKLESFHNFLGKPLQCNLSKC